MNAAETIQAAIDRLTELRNDAVPGTWKAGRRAGELGWFVAGAYGDFLTTGYVGNRDSKPTAEIIVTLHRTIDAQLAILQHVRNAQLNYVTPGQAWGESEEASYAGTYPEELALARAILGGDQ